jgi:hypothetical protein
MQPNTSITEGFSMFTGVFVGNSPQQSAARVDTA